VYFGKLSRTYALLFALNAEPRLVEYFQEMSSDFYLYVGSDILVQALSERFLDPKDQRTRNMLRIVGEAGATLVLTEPVLDEVLGHLRATDREFEYFFEPVEGEVMLEIARQAPKILIRAYFYSRLDPPSPELRVANWPAFVSQFCDYSSLGQKKIASQLRSYLQAQFNMTYVSNSELERLVRTDELEGLVQRLRAVKDVEVLARNDALLVLAVYGRRGTEGEQSHVTEFGYRTWWLTGETHILTETRELVRNHGGARYVMRPEFLLNFIALSPTTSQIRRAFRTIFPTLLGISLAKRMDEEEFSKLMKKVEDANKLEPGRRQAVMSELADRLKSDFIKQYSANL
jgi:hypothetical protein